MPNNFGQQLAEQAGTQAAGGIIGAGMGLALGGLNDKRQLRMSRLLGEQQYALTNRMAESNYERQMRMWEATNFGPQMEQLKKAGLNPALIYDGAGAGGSTAAATGQGLGGGEAPRGGGEAMGLMTTQMQLGLMEAQRKLIEAQTTKTNAEVPKTQAETESITQGITNQKTQNALMQAQTMATQTNTENVQTQTKLIEDQIMIMDNDVAISNATREDKIRQIRAEATGAILTNEATKMGIQVDKATIQKMAQDIAQGWTGLDIKAKEQKIQQAFLEKQIDMAGIDRIIKSVDVITNAIPSKKIFNQNIHTPRVWDDANR